MPARGPHRTPFETPGPRRRLLTRHAQRKLEEACDHQLAGFPLGVAEGIPYEGIRVPLQPGDAVVVFTDGITEAKNRQDREFQMENVYRVLQEGPTDPGALGKRLVDAVN